MTDATAERFLRVAVERVRLTNYRSIESCDVRLGRLAYLVGPNGAGKSNFFDALGFVSDALAISLEQAVRLRGGFGSIHRAQALAADVTAVMLDLRTADAVVSYGFQLRFLSDSQYEILEEHCSVRRYDALVPPASFQRSRGGVVSSEPELPLPSPTRLYLVTAASLPAFRQVFDALSRMAFYNLNPAAMRDLQPPDPGEILDRDGANAAAAVGRLSRDAPVRKKLIEDYLSAVVPGILAVETQHYGERDALSFIQQPVEGRGWIHTFLAGSMSDGTLRAFGVLLALFQQLPPGQDLLLVGIEEPEAAVHPAAAAVLRDAIAEASQTRQVLVTTHSPDLLDDPELDPESLLAVEWVRGRTVISRPDRAGLSALRDGLYTAGELLRVGQLVSEPEFDDR